MLLNSSLFWVLLAFLQFLPLAKATASDGREAVWQSPRSRADMRIRCEIEVLTPTDGVDVNGYSREVYQKTKKTWLSYLPSLPSGQELKSVVELRILQHGNVPADSLKLALASGTKEYDDWCVQAVREAAPFEPLA